MLNKMILPVSLATLAASDAANPVVVSSKPRLEIDHETVSTDIFARPLIHEGKLPVTSAKECVLKELIFYFY